MAVHDERFMRMAMALAQAAADAGEVPVGAVIVDETTGEVVGKGMNGPVAAHDPTAHAEIVALREAGHALSNYRLTDLTLYVTLEPCAMCAGAISHARIGRVVWAADDPKGGAVLHGPRFFEQSTCHWKPDLDKGPLGEESGEILRAFFRSKRKPSVAF
jgi:tRNA(Arg) A34 adenosine deaminase TadA